MQKEQITIDQHFVSQCYLKNFTSGDGKVFAYTKRGQLLKNKYAPVSIVFSKLLYEFNLDNPDNRIEKFFSKLENDYSSLSDKLLALNGPEDFVLDTNEQINLLLFILRLSLGNPSQYNKGNTDGYNKIWERELELHDLTESEKQKSRELLKEENRKILPTVILVGFNEIFLQKIFSRKKFLFYLSNGKDLFITGDNPVLEWYTHETGLFPGTTTLDDINYGVSLSPYIHLQIVDIADYPEIPNLSLLHDEDGSMAKKHNAQILEQSMNFVYSNSNILHL